MGPRHVIVVGASLAGTRSAEALRREGYDGRLTIVGAERHPPYQRPPLSKQLLAGQWERARVDLRVRTLDAELRLETRATALDLDSRELVISDGHGEERLAFDGMVIATGCRPRTLPNAPQPGEVEGLHVLRTVDDCLALRRDLESRPTVAVVGAGFIGCEVAATCRSRGLDVTLIDPLEAPLAQSIGVAMGQVIAQAHEDNGTSLKMRTGVSGVVGNGRVEGVVLDDGSILAADVVVVGLGVVPSTDWLEGSGLHLDNGVVCDSRCAAEGASGVVAAGDVARWFHPTAGHHVRVEHFDNATAQALAAARALLDGDSAPAYDPVPSFWSDQYDVKLQLLGSPEPNDRVEVMEGDVRGGRFIAAYERDGRTVAALSMNEPARLRAYRPLVAERLPFPTSARDPAEPPG